MKTLALAVTLLLMVALLVPAVAKDMPDVPFGHWAYDAVDELTDLGVVEGYPDGTFKGDRTWTRYEFATMLVRMIDFLEDYLDDKVAGMDMGITESAARAIAREEAQKAAAGVQLPDVAAFMNQVTSTAQAAGAAAAREALAGYKPGISKAEAQAMIDAAVKNFVDKGALDAMAQEFRGELAMLGADVDDLMYRVDALETKFAALEARVTALENKPDKVTGEIRWIAGTNEAPPIWEDGGDFIDRAYYPFREGWNRFSNLSVKVHIDGKLSDKAKGHITLWRPDATYDWDAADDRAPERWGRGTHIDTAYIDVEDGLFKGVDWRLGRQYFKTGCSLTFDNDLMPSEAVKLMFGSEDLQLTGFFGWTDISEAGFADEVDGPVYLGNARFGFGNLSLDGTYVFRAAESESWGIAAMYDGLQLPFLGLNANLQGEWSTLEKGIGGWDADDYNEAYFVRADFVGKDYEPGDWKFGVSWAEQQFEYWPAFYGGEPYDIYVLYNGVPWDYALGGYLQLGQPGWMTWTADLEKKWDHSGIYLRWARLDPMRENYFRQPGDLEGPMKADLYQVSYDRELTEDVWARLTWARINEEVLMFNEYWEEFDMDYFSGEVNVLF